MLKRLAFGLFAIALLAAVACAPAFAQGPPGGAGPDQAPGISPAIDPVTGCRHIDQSATTYWGQQLYDAMHGDQALPDPPTVRHLMVGRDGNQSLTWRTPPTAQLPSSLWPVHTPVQDSYTGRAGYSQYWWAYLDALERHIGAYSARVYKPAGKPFSYGAPMPTWGGRLTPYEVGRENIYVFGAVDFVHVPRTGNASIHRSGLTTPLSDACWHFRAVPGDAEPAGAPTVAD